MASGLQAEDELQLAQAEFDKQAEVTKRLLEDISSTHVRPHKGHAEPPVCAVNHLSVRWTTCLCWWTTCLCAEPPVCALNHLSCVCVVSWTTCAACTSLWRPRQRTTSSVTCTWKTCRRSWRGRTMKQYTVIHITTEYYSVLQTTTHQYTLLVGA